MLQCHVLGKCLLGANCYTCVYINLLYIHIYIYIYIYIYIWRWATCGVIAHTKCFISLLSIVGIVLCWSDSSLRTTFHGITPTFSWRWVMASEGNPKYNCRAALVLGILQVICGVANICIQVPMYVEHLHVIGPVSAGIWTGVFVSGRTGRVGNWIRQFYPIPLPVLEWLTISVAFVISRWYHFITAT